MFQVKINSSHILRHFVVNILTHPSGKHNYVQPNNTIKVDNKVTRKPQLALYHSIYRVCQL